MLGRRAAGRRHRHLRDRGNAGTVLPRATPRSPLAQVYDTSSTVVSSSPSHTFVWPDPAYVYTNVLLVASFDGWLHHRMLRDADVPSVFRIQLRVPPGRHTYKYLVDGVWSTRPAGDPVEISADGVRHHVLHCPRVSHDDSTASLAALLPDKIATDRLQNDIRHDDDTTRTRATVFRSASANVVPQSHIRATGDLARPRIPFKSQSSSVSVQEVSRRNKEPVAPRGSSFTAAPTMPSMSAAHMANRKSMLLRVGSGWMKRFSSRAPDADASLDCASTTAQDRSTSSIFRPKERASLFPSSSEPLVGKTDDKENVRRVNTPATPDRSRRAAGRGSRTANVKVSRPTKVDEPRDVDEVNRQADNWRQMARHLQDDLCDPTGARELFSRAIQHREKHGLWCTSQNAQAHVDLARNLSKAEMMKDAEFHLRIALRIYNQIEAGHEHIADLLLYVGVVVDRQKKRREAEDLYRTALQMYKTHGISGNNLDIAVKNLSLNLRKQNREAEVEQVRKEFCAYKASKQQVA